MTSFLCRTYNGVCGPNWIIIGEAASQSDPITGNGVTAALRHAAEASSLVCRYHQRDKFPALARISYNLRVLGAGRFFNSLIEKMFYDSFLRARLGLFGIVQELLQRLVLILFQLREAIKGIKRPELRRSPARSAPAASSHCAPRRPSGPQCRTHSRCLFLRCRAPRCWATPATTHSGCDGFGQVEFRQACHGYIMDVWRFELKRRS